VPAVAIGRGSDVDGRTAAAERLRRDVASDTTPAVSRRSSDTTRSDLPAKVTAADVSTETVLVFGDSAPPVTVAAVTPGAPRGPVWDIDVRSYETLARVEDYVRIFSGRAKDVFSTALQRQTRYGPMIRERLRRVGLPENLTYLALVESWFNPHAYSRAAAVGVWQFMAGTARGMGLRVDWWMDERRDPVRSTEAAARLLTGLRKEFGSLYLAAAAYNGGSGRVSRGLARYAEAMDGVEGEDRFFALAEKSYLRPETRDYVPKIIAAALVGEQPARYGVTVDSLAPYVYDSVRAPGGTPLAAVANAVGVAPTEVAELNPALLRGMTPPKDSLWVRVPVGSGAGFAVRFNALEPAERLALTRVESRKGQSMASIGRKHDLTARQLGWFNPKVAKLKSGALRAGQVILVPRHDVVMLARDVPNPSIEKYPARRRTSAARRTRTGSAKSRASKPGVKSGVKKPSAKSGVKKPAAKSGAKKKSGKAKTAAKKPDGEPAKR
jgi:membrane-bound lytic murein transglycosylase D